MSTYNTLGGKTLAELPQIPTQVATGSTETAGAIVLNWQNNNTNVTGTTNLTQYYDNGEWNDSNEVAASATTAIITGLTELTEYNCRVGVKTSDIRIYPSVPIEGFSSDTPFPLSGLVARWEFEDNLNDSYGGYTLSTTSAVQYTTGKVGNCVRFTSTFPSWMYIRSSNANLLSVFSGTNAFSLSVWNYAADDSTTAGNNIMKSLGDYILEMGGGALWRMTWRDDTYDNLSSYENQWNHVVFTYDGTTEKLYINNTLVASNTASTELTGLTQFNLFGNFSYDGNYLDQSYLYNRALTSTEIAKLWNGGSGI